MNLEIARARLVVRRPRLIARLSLALILSAGSVLLSSSLAWAGLVPTSAGPSWAVDDMNSSTVNPAPAINVSTIPGAQCPWINTGLNDFEAAHAGWSHVWAPQAQMAAVESGISILDYFAWVVTEPTITTATDINDLDHVYGPDAPLQPNSNVNDVGGAVFNLKYTPQPGAPAIADLHWIQAYNGSAFGGALETKLDNGAAMGNSPFYDDGGAAGTQPGGGGWFLDRPWAKEGEYEGNPVSSYQFQVVLADFNSTTKVVTLYGGLWWGYQYTASDVRVPEPATYVLFVIGGLGLFVFRRARVRKCNR